MEVHILLPFLHLLILIILIHLYFFCSIQRHNTSEHGGRMSRSQRSAALQACLSSPSRLSSCCDYFSVANW